MKIGIASDLHLEMLANRESPMLFGKPGDVDIIILAGDIAAGVNGVEFGASLSGVMQCPVYVIAGNHEFYRREYHKTIKDCRAAAEMERLRGNNVHFLSGDLVDVNDEYMIFGATLWTDFALDGDTERAKTIAQACMNDYRLISYGDKLITPEDVDRIHDHERAALFFAEAKSYQLKKKFIVVTHHCPSPSCIHARYKGNYMNPCFTSNLDDFIEANSEDIPLWVHGHTHEDVDVHVGKTRIVCHPRGYNGERNDFHHYSMKIVEI